MFAKDDAQCSSFCRACEWLGFRHSVVKEVQASLGCFRDHHHDIVILDHRDPKKLDAEALCRWAGDREPGRCPWKIRRTLGWVIVSGGSGVRGTVGSAYDLLPHVPSPESWTECVNCPGLWGSGPLHHPSSCVRAVGPLDQEYSPQRLISGEDCLWAVLLASSVPSPHLPRMSK